MGGRSIPLARLLSKRGVCSRAKAVDLVVEGHVAVSGRLCRDPLKRFPADAALSIGGKPCEARSPGRMVLALHKPQGTLTTTRDPQGRPTVFDLLPKDLPRLIAVGRLDKASRGLLLFTSDPALADRLTDPNRHVPKTYHARMNRRLTPEEIDRLAHGIVLDDGMRTRPCRARLIRQGPKTCWVELVLTEGKNRQVRRMAEALGARVTGLVRVAIGGLALGALRPGETRVLSPADIRSLLSPAVPVASAL